MDLLTTEGKWKIFKDDDTLLLTHQDSDGTDKTVYRVFATDNDSLEELQRLVFYMYQLELRARAR